MLTCTVNGEARTLPEPLTVAQLLERLGYDRRRVAVEVNGLVVPAVAARRAVADVRRSRRDRHAGRRRLERGGAGRQTARHRQIHFPQPAHHRHRQIRQLRVDARLPGGERLRGDDGRRAPRTSGGQAGPQYPRLSRPEALHDSAEHGRLLQRRGRRASRPPGARAARPISAIPAPTGSSWSAWATSKRCCPTRSPR